MYRDGTRHASLFLKIAVFSARNLLYSISYFSKMATSSQLDAEERITCLRAELKEWEKAFSDANGGRKATREDIKNDPAIGK